MAHSNKIISEIVQFWQQPSLNKHQFDSSLDLIKTLSNINALQFLLNLVVLLLISPVYNLLSKANTNVATVFDELNELGLAGALITILVIVILEEALFRLWVSKKYYITILGLTLSLIFNLLLVLTPEKLPFQIPHYLNIIFGFWVLIRLFIDDGWIENNLRSLVVISSILFGLYHLSNYNEYNNLIYLVPILTITRIISGFCFLYVRIKIGFWWACFNHLVFDLILFVSFQTQPSLVNFGSVQSYALLTSYWSIMIGMLILNILMMRDFLYSDDRTQLKT